MPNIPEISSTIAILNYVFSYSAKYAEQQKCYQIAPVHFSLSKTTTSAWESKQANYSNSSMLNFVELLRYVAVHTPYISIRLACIVYRDLES